MPRAAVRRPLPVDAIAAINITPLIDVMLVLLIMMIMTLPISTHKLPIDIPQDGGVRDAPPPHRLDITAAGALLWDGAPLADAALPARLAPVGARADSVLYLRTDPAASYDRFATVLEKVKRAGIQHLGFIGNETMVERGQR